MDEQAFPIDRDGGEITRLNVRELIEIHTPKLPLQIAFQCFGASFTATACDGADGAVLTITGCVGSVPYTAESQAARETARAIIEQKPQCATARLSVVDRHHIFLHGELALGGPPTPSRIVATVTAIMASARPMVELVQDFLTPPESGYRAA